MKDTKKVLILSCGTGEGHNSAAKALADALAESGAQCEIKDVLTFRSEKTSRRVAGVYNTAIKRTPALFGLAYTLGKLYDELRLPSPIYSANAKYADKLNAYINENGFKRVICTHLFAMEAMTAVRNKYGVWVKCYGVMTDYTIHPFIKDTALDGYFVPNETVANQFIKKGFAKDKIFVTGIPVNYGFSESISKNTSRIFLDLPQDKKIIAVMAGGAGCGKIVKLCAKLNKQADENCMIIAFTGRNAKLKAKLDRMFSNNSKIRTVAFTDQISLYMKAADVVISKSGGLSSTEIAVANVPLVHLKAIPGLETANLKYFSKNGLSLKANTVKRAVACAQWLLSEEADAAAMLKIQKFLINSNATREITERITEGLINERAFMGNVYSGRISFGQYTVLQDYPETVGA